jgi:hypothetical protein
MDKKTERQFCVAHGVVAVSNKRFTCYACGKSVTVAGSTIREMIEILIRTGWFGEGYKYCSHRCWLHMAQKPAKVDQPWQPDEEQAVAGVK